MKPDDPLDTAKGVMIGVFSSILILIIAGFTIKLASIFFMFGWRFL